MRVMLYIYNFNIAPFKRGKPSEIPQNHSFSGDQYVECDQNRAAGNARCFTAYHIQCEHHAAKNRKCECPDRNAPRKRFIRSEIVDGFV